MLPHKGGATTRTGRCARPPKSPFRVLAAGRLIRLGHGPPKCVQTNPQGPAAAAGGVLLANTGFNSSEWLDAIPADRVGEIHLAGHSLDAEGTLLIDSHDAPSALKSGSFTSSSSLASDHARRSSSATATSPRSRS